MRIYLILVGFVFLYKNSVAFMHKNINLKLAKMPKALSCS